LITPGRKSPADILIVLPDEAQREIVAETARTLRNQGLKVETYHNDTKIKKQLAYAEKKGIPYVWFPPFSECPRHEVKNMVTGEQTTVTPETFKK